MYKLKPEGWLKVKDFIVIDLLALICSFFIVYTSRFQSINFISDKPYLKMIIILLIMDILLIILFDVFRNVEERGYYKEFVITIKHSTRLIVFFISYSYLIQVSDEYSRIVTLLTFFLYIVIGYVTRILWKKSKYRQLLRREKRISVIAVSLKKNMNLIKENIDYNSNNYKLKYFCVDENDISDDVFLECIISYSSKEWVDEAYLDNNIDRKLLNKLADSFRKMGIVVHVKLDLMYDSHNQKQFVEKFGNSYYVTNTINVITTKQALIKRLIDIFFGIIGCIITVLLTIIISPIIYFNSPRPIFFSQKRIGKNGKQFKLYKYRTMIVDAEKQLEKYRNENQVDSNLMFKMEFDPRIIGNKIREDGKHCTGIGSFLRKYSLDEFPQFFNVLRGDMSLVGTRPPTENEWNEYQLHHRARLAIKPGITGLWQVSGRSNITDFEEVVRLDTEYIENWSIGLDLKILLKTIVVVLKKEGSM